MRALPTYKRGIHGVLMVFGAYIPHYACYADQVQQENISLKLALLR